MRLIDSIIRQPARVAFTRSSSDSSTSVGLDSTRDGEAVTISASDGSFVVIPGADPSGAGALTAADKAALDALGGSQYESKATAEAATVPGSRAFLRTAGYGAAGDGGAALYRKVAADPGHPGRIRSADGAWWELVPANGAINVKQLGAIGDGVTDDVRAINDAVAAAGALGARLDIVEGTYLVGEHPTIANNAIYISQSGVTVRGAGVGRTKIRLANAAQSMVFQISAASGVTISDLEIDGNFANQSTAPGVHGILVRDGDHVRLENLYIHDTVSYGIGAQGGANKRLFINNVRFFQTGFNGIDVKNKDNGNNAVVISNIVAERWGQNTSQGAKAAVTVRGRANISNVHCRDFGGPDTSATTGVRLREGEATDANGFGGHYSTVTNVVVEGNDKTATIGVEVLARHCAVSGVTVSGVSEGVRIAQRSNALSGIQVYDCTKGINVIDLNLPSTPSFNSVTGFTISNCVQGMEVDGSQNSFSGFTIEGCSTRAVNVETGSSYNNFEAGLVNNSGPFLDNGTFTRIQGVRGVVTVASALTDPVAVDTAGGKTVTVAHNLDFTPSNRDFSVTPFFSGPGYTDGAFHWRVNSADATSVTLGVNVTTASATAGAEVRFNVVGRVKDWLTI